VAQAGNKTITWILLAEAARLIASAYGYSLKRAEQDLVQWLGDSQNPIRWKGELRGWKLDSDPGEGSAEFWQGGPGVQLKGPLSENMARRTTGAFMGRHVVRPGGRLLRPRPASNYGFDRIQVAREDVIARLPTDDLAEPVARTVKDQVIAAAVQMKTKGDIPEGITKTDFARELARRIGQPANHLYIRNQLEKNWGLWPVDLIKLKIT
jgi:hypothetical protein